MFDLNYKFINGSFAFTPWLNLYISSVNRYLVVVVAMKKKIKFDPAKKLETRYVQTAMKVLPNKVKYTKCYIVRYFSGM